jgi:divalent metal cation (Fe/Co/Zn/Cd) transporter
MQQLVSFFTTFLGAAGIFISTGIIYHFPSALFQLVPLWVSVGMAVIGFAASIAVFFYTYSRRGMRLAAGCLFCTLLGSATATMVSLVATVAMFPH